MSRRVHTPLTRWVQQRARHREVQRALGMQITSDLPAPCKVEVREHHAQDVWRIDQGRVGTVSTHGYGLLIGDREVFLGQTVVDATTRLRQLVTSRGCRRAS